MYLTQDAASSWKYAANTGTYSSYAARISIYRTSSSASAYFNQYYVRSSPPYDFGDGEIAGTLFAEVDANGAVIRMYSADAPPWINNGPTNCRADFTTKNGKKYQIVRVGHRVREGLKRGKVTPEVALRTVRKHYADEPSIVKKLRLGQISIDQFLNDSRAHRCLGTHVIEIDHGVKNADMPILPQPFEGNNPKRTILIDPMDTRVRDLLDLQDDGENVIDYFLDGAIRVDNEPLKRHGPPGVMAVKMKL